MVAINRILSWLLPLLLAVPAWAEESVTPAPAPATDVGTLFQGAWEVKRAHPELYGGVVGLFIVEVLPDSQAGMLGLQAGDVVLRYGDHAPETLPALIQLQDAIPVSETVAMEYLRAQELWAVKVRQGRLGTYMAAMDTPASGLTLMGDRFRAHGHYPEALAHHNQALALYREIGDRQGEGNVLNNLGFVYWKLDKYPQALEYYAQALALYRELGNRPGEGTALNNLGLTYANLDQYPQALEYYTQALALYRELGDRPGEVKALNYLGGVYWKLDQYRIALEHYTQALALYRELGDRPGEGMALNNLGLTYANLDQYPQALEHHTQALALYRELGDRPGEGKSLTYLGNVFRKLGQYPQAQEYYAQALAIYRELGDRPGEGKALNNLGLVYRYLGQYPQAQEHHTQALALYRELGNRMGEGNALINLGVVYYHLGQYPRAQELATQALAFYRELGNRPGEGNALTNLGNVYWRLGQYPKALERYVQALALFRELGDRSGEGNTLNNLGLIYYDFGQYPRAQDYYVQALALYREHGKRQYEGLALGNLGNVYMTLGQYPKALEHHTQALALYRELGNRQGEGTALGNLGRVYDELGQYPKAQEYYAQALALFRELGDRKFEGTALINIGTVYWELDQYPKAQEYYVQALAVTTELGAPDSLWRVWGGLRRTLAALDRPEAAVFAGKQAVNTLQVMRGEITSLGRTEQRGFFEEKTFIYRELADLLIGEGRLPEAQQVLAMLKEEEYFDFIRRDASRGDVRQTRVDCTSAEAPWCMRYQEISAQLASLGQEYAALKQKEKGVLTETEQARSDQLRADLKAAGKVFNTFLDRLEVGLARTDRKVPEEVGKRHRQLQGALRELGHGAVAVHYFMSDEQLNILVTTTETQVAHQIPVSETPLEKPLNKTVFDFRESLDNPHQDPQATAKVLYDTLVAPIKADLKQAAAQTLMVSLDGALRYLPLAALHDGEHYLAERYAVVIYTEAANLDLTGKRSAHWQVAGLGVSQSKQGDLQTVPIELETIVRRNDQDSDGVLPGVVHLDAGFTESALQGGLRYPVLHVASHFVFNPGNVDNSYLVLGNDQELTLAQIRDEDLDLSAVELLTLSACNTAMGGSGSEIEGFGALAQDQGAKGVLATLWPVADTSTGLFMAEFYRVREAQDLTKAEALRRTQLAFITGVIAPETRGTAVNRGVGCLSCDTDEKETGPTSTDYRHPYYWAPFILMGNWL